MADHSSFGARDDPLVRGVAPDNTFRKGSKDETLWGKATREGVQLVPPYGDAQSSSAGLDQSERVNCRMTLGGVPHTAPHDFSRVGHPSSLI